MNEEGNTTSLIKSNGSSLFIDNDDKESVYNYVPETSFLSTSLGISLMVITGLITIVIFSLPLIYYWRKRSYQNVTKEVLDEFLMEGNSFGTGDRNPGQLIDGDVGHYELLETEFNIDEESIISQGAFGKVCRGTVTKGGVETEVAVKIIVPAPCGSRYHISEIFYEIKNLSYLGNHPNIVELVGVFTAKLKHGKIFSFLELCPLGSLEAYLKNYNSNDDEVFELDESLTSDMYRWSLEITSGLEYVASKRVVLIDIATRNILLTADKRAKLSDLGLSRRLYNYGQYVMREQEQVPLPWRWMAPESLRTAVFSEKSDVWAFGITLWEIFSVGEEPYTGLSWDVNFVTKLERGLRLGSPISGRNNLYPVMLRCWATRPEMRPTFSQLMNLVKQHSIEKLHHETIAV